MRGGDRDREEVKVQRGERRLGAAGKVGLDGHGHVL